ncbi:MAG: MarR family winged helix-turn-helix transcriptional regulator [Sarcina sp.]
MFFKELEDSAYGSFLKSMKLHYKCNQKILEKKGLYAGQPPLLFSLMKNEVLSQKEIAEKLNIKPATVNVMVKRLEKTGLVEKSKDEVDLRISRIRLTTKGQETCLEAMDTMAKMSKKIFQCLTEDEEETLKILLNKVNENMKKNLENFN